MQSLCIKAASHLGCFFFTIIDFHEKTMDGLKATKNAKPVLFGQTNFGDIHSIGQTKETIKISKIGQKTVVESS